VGAIIIGVKQRKRTSLYPVIDKLHRRFVDTLQTTILEKKAGNIIHELERQRVRIIIAVVR